MSEIRNAVSKSLVDSLIIVHAEVVNAHIDNLTDIPTRSHSDVQDLGADDHAQYVLADGSRNITENFMFDKHVGISVAPTDSHLFLITETLTGTGSKVGMGCFPTYLPDSNAPNTVYALQGNVWFGTQNWDAGSLVNALWFVPAPYATNVGSADLDIVGVSTGGLINVGARTVVAKTLTGLLCPPVSAIFGGGGNTTVEIVRGIHVPSAVGTDGTWGRLSGIEIGPQTSGVINQGLWLSGDGIGADMVFGEANDATIYYDGDDLVINPQLVGAGGVRILSMKSGATQGAAVAAADELWKTNGHATLPDNVVMIGV